jgi:hypothetical protein
MKKTSRRRKSHAKTPTAPIALKAVARMAVEAGGSYHPSMYDDAVGDAYALVRQIFSRADAPETNIPDLAERLYRRDKLWTDASQHMRRLLKKWKVTTHQAEHSDLVYQFEMAAREAGFLLGLSTAYEVLRSTHGGAR